MIALTNGWTAEARCRGVDPLVFYPPESATKAERLASEEQARKICGFCPCRRRCLDFALSMGQNDQQGFWGGKSAEERMEILRQRGLARTRKKKGRRPWE